MASRRSPERTVKLTEEVIKSKMRLHMERAKKELMKANPDPDPDCTPLEHAAIAVWNNGIEKYFPGRWKGLTEKRIWGRAVSEACKLSHVSVITGRFIATMVSSEKVAEELGIDPGKMSFDEYQTKMFDWVERTTGQKRLAYLPEKFRQDCIIVCAMGPGFQDLILNQPYEFRNGVWLFPQVQFPYQDEGQINVIPKWWQ